MSATKEESFTFSCECGATLRARLSIVGRKAKCKTCGRIITIPKPREAYTFGTPDGNRQRLEGWGDCRGRVVQHLPDADRVGRAEDCLQQVWPPFHEECWRENLGCSAYGCPNVDALKGGPDIHIENPPPLPLPPPPAEDDIPWGNIIIDPPPLPPDGMPWEFVLLAASVFATILGAFMCGLPTIVVAVINGIYLAKTTRRPNMAAVVTCFVVCGIGILVDLVVSAQIYSQ